MSGEIGAGTLLSGRYRLQEVLGSGGFGQVYAAVDQVLGRWVAVKVPTLRAEWEDGERGAWQARFRREAVAAAALNHPNVAVLHDAGEHQGRPFIVMELLPGTDLRQVLLRHGGLPVPDVLAYGAQICAGLRHAHEHGLVHRDIKPENLMLLPGGVVKICDFGLAAHRDAAPAGFTHPHPQPVLGSPLYCSPEQALGAEVTERSDLYSLGCVLYAMLAEGPPFSADSHGGYAYLHVHRAPEPIENRRPEVPAGLARLVHRMLAKDPVDRPADAREVEDLLLSLLREPAPVPGLPAASDSAPRHTVWALLEEAEGLLALGSRQEADRRCRQALQQIAQPGAGTAEGTENGPAYFAALFGRARALEGIDGPVQTVRRLEELAGLVESALGARHPLARCVAGYAAVRSAHER